MFAALKPVIDEKEDAIRRTFAAVREACQIFHAETSTIPEEIAAKYGLKPEDARKWYEGVKITASNKLSEAALERAVSALADVNVLPTKEVQLKSLFDSRFAELEVDIKRMKLYVTYLQCSVSFTSILVTLLHRYDEYLLFGFSTSSFTCLTGFRCTQIQQT
jgi:hypothetical protein